MKHPSLVLLIACLWCWAPLAQLRAIPLTVFLGGSPPSGGPTYVINEDFDGTGTSAGWTNAGTSSPNWDYSTAPAPLSGTQSLRIAHASSNAWITIPDGDSYTYTFEFLTPDDTPIADTNLASLRTSSGTSIAFPRWKTTGALTLYADGSEATAITDLPPANTKIFIKVVWIDGGTSSVEWNTSNSFSGSGSKYTSKPGGTTTDCTRFYIGSPTGGSTVGNLYDNVQLY